MRSREREKEGRRERKREVDRRRDRRRERQREKDVPWGSVGRAGSNTRVVGLIPTRDQNKNVQKCIYSLLQVPLGNSVCYITHMSSDREVEG